VNDLPAGLGRGAALATAMASNRRTGSAGPAGGRQEPGGSSTPKDAAALVRTLPSMAAAPSTPVRRDRRSASRTGTPTADRDSVASALRSHAEERTVYEATMERERQRQRKELMARMQHQALMEERRVLASTVTTLELALHEAHLERWVGAVVFGAAACAVAQRCAAQPAPEPEP
jgi:hypothetical protein